MSDMPLQPGKPCPLCGKPALHAFQPFCSRRCADIDLNRWLSGVYAIPATEEDDEEERPPDPRRSGLPEG
ncbi:MAG: DNA gyrase inhibitor YacG [Pseudorhodoplanes sp.]